MSFPGSVLLDQGEIFKPHVTKRFPLGTRGYTRDGRAFRYARAGAAALVPGMLIQAPAVDTEVVAQEYADSTDWAAPTTNSTVFYLSTDTTIATANFFKDGYFMVTAGSTSNVIGQMVQIESHSGAAGAAGATGVVKVYPYSEERLTAAFTTANTVSIIANPYNNVIVSLDAAPTGIPVGVCPASVTAAYYFWLQTWGMACMRVSDTWDTGHSIIYASATGTREGESLPWSTLESDKGAAVVGIANYIGTDGYAGAGFLTLAP